MTGPASKMVEGVITAATCKMLRAVRDGDDERYVALEAAMDLLLGYESSVADRAHTRAWLEAVASGVQDAPPPGSIGGLLEGARPHLVRDAWARDAEWAEDHA